MKTWDQISIRKVRRQILGNHLFSQIVSISNDPDCKFLWICSSRYEAEVIVFVESFSSSSRTNMGLKYSLRHELFSEKKPYIQWRTKTKNRASYISFWLRATCINSTLTVFTPSNIFYQTRAPIITHILLVKIIVILIMLEKYLLESECVII